MAAKLANPLAGPTRPLGSPEIPQFHLPPSDAASGTYSPWLYGAATIHFGNQKRKLNETRRVAFRVPLTTATRTIEWESAQPIDVMPEALLKSPAVEAPYLPLPAGAMTIKTFTRWAKNLDRWLARTQRLEVAPKLEPKARTDAPKTEAVAEPEAPQPELIGPKRGGVAVELVAILWDLA